MIIENEVLEGGRQMEMALDVLRDRLAEAEQKLKQCKKGTEEYRICNAVIETYKDAIMIVERGIELEAQ
jgi:hypothetical protein